VDLTTLNETVISQYANSPALTAIIASMNQAIDPATNLQQFYSYVWDIDTAQGFGLDNWGLILGVSRYVQLPNVGAYVGFSGTAWTAWGVGAWYSGGAVSSAYAMTDVQYRQVLLAKALANITRCSIQGLNAVAQALFGVGAMCVVDLGNMNMAYVFATTPSNINLGIAQNASVLPDPTGVGTNVLTAKLNNAVLAAAPSGSYAGYSRASYGTLTPNVDLNSHNINQVYYLSTGPSVGLVIANATSLTASYFTYLVINGQVLASATLGSTGSFAFAGGLNTWIWSGTGVTLPVMAGGSNYTVLIA
jgi:hypothetical protein